MIVRRSSTTKTIATTETPFPCDASPVVVEVEAPVVVAEPVVAEGPVVVEEEEVVAEEVVEEEVVAEEVVEVPMLLQGTLSGEKTSVFGSEVQLSKGIFSYPLETK